MVYQLRKHDSLEDFTNEEAIGTIAWETDDILFDDMRFCGKLIAYYSNRDTVVIPDGIETLGYSFLVPYFWGGWGSSVDTVRIPASVKTIEEGAFAFTSVSNIEIDPDSPCGIVKENGLYTKDGKTLLWVMGENTAEDCVYVVPEGVTRIGVDFLDFDFAIDEVVVPSSVTYIGYNEKYRFNYERILIKAPKGAYAIEFAKENGIKFEELD